MLEEYVGPESKLRKETIRTNDPQHYAVGDSVQKSPP